MHDLAKMRKEIIERRIEELQSKDAGTRWTAASMLTEHLTRQWLDISAAIPALAVALGDSNESVRTNAADALSKAAQHRLDVSCAIDALTARVGNEGYTEGGYAAEALGHAAENGIDISNSVQDLARCVDKDLGFASTNSAEALAKAAENGIDISTAVPALTKALESNGKFIVVPAAEALAAMKKELADAKKLLQKVAKERPELKKELTEAYIRIVKAKKRPKIEGLLLDAKIKPPKKGEIFRVRRVAHA